MTLEQLNTKLDELRSEYQATFGTTWTAMDQKDANGVWWIQGVKPDSGDEAVFLEAPSRDKAREMAKRLNETGGAQVNKDLFTEFMRELLAGEFTITLSPAHGLKELAKHEVMVSAITVSASAS